MKRPVYCTLQGEDLFLSLLEEPYRTTALELIRAKVSDIDGFMAVSDYYAEFMCRYLHIPERKDARRASGNQPGRVRSQGTRRIRLLQGRLLRASGAGERSASASGELPAVCGPIWISARHRSKWLATWRRSTGNTSPTPSSA